MAKKATYHHYVLVLTSYGPVFVTGEGAGKTSFWKKEDKPYEMSEGWADDMAFGLMVNGYTAFHVKSKIEIDRQPYMYDKGEFAWHWNDESEDKEDKEND